MLKYTIRVNQLVLCDKNMSQGDEVQVPDHFVACAIFAPYRRQIRMMTAQKYNAIRKIVYFSAKILEAKS